MDQLDLSRPSRWILRLTGELLAFVNLLRL